MSDELHEIPSGWNVTEIGETRRLRGYTVRPHDIAKMFSQRLAQDGGVVIVAQGTGFPHGARIERVSYLPTRDAFLLVASHESFGEVSGCAEIPIWPEPLGVELVAVRVASDDVDAWLLKDLERIMPKTKAADAQSQSETSNESLGPSGS